MSLLSCLISSAIFWKNNTQSRCILFLSCQNNHQRTFSFNYWKAVLKLLILGKNVLKENDVSKLYILCFDADIKENTPLPVLPIIFKDKVQNFEIVLVVFIWNYVMLNDDVNLEDLGEKIRNLVAQINKNLNSTNKCNFEKSVASKLIIFLEREKKNKFQIYKSSVNFWKSFDNWLRKIIPRLPQAK